MKLSKTKFTRIPVDLTVLNFHRSKSAVTNAKVSVFGHDYNKQR